jgi:hypothetical protein
MSSGEVLPSASTPYRADSGYFGEFPADGPEPGSRENNVSSKLDQKRFRDLKLWQREAVVIGCPKALS